MEEKIKTKLTEIAREKERTMANYNALCGAEQILTQLIEELNADEQNNND